jgi:hypothetical protein
MSNYILNENQNGNQKENQNGNPNKTSNKYILLDGTKLYIRRCNIGKFGICEIPDEELENIVKNIVSEKIYIKTEYSEWLLLQNKKKFIIKSEDKIRNMWFCKIVKLENIELELKSELKSESENKDILNISNIPIVKIIYGRCVDSMTFLDTVYREHINKYKFKNGDIIGIKSVAGSGKTTTLLNLAKIHKDKRILYIAFNKSLIVEIKDKIKNDNIKNLFPQTFDALMRSIYIIKKNIDIDTFSMIDLKPQNLGFVIDWFSNKPYRIKNYFVKNYSKFCNQAKYSKMNDFCNKILGGEKKMLNTMWQKSMNGEFTTFDFIRKFCEVEHICRGYLDNMYDMIFIDESQDFDNVMLKILLDDTTIPKLFVGDTKQAIYEWKGCINAFDNLPENSLIFEFYSTFRVGEPACSQIREKFLDCNMISKSKNETILEYNTQPNDTEKYVYLFRSWKNLLQNAQYLEKIWINNFDSQIDYMRKLHNRLKISNLDNDELGEFSDDLPKFLLKMSAEDLEKMINDICKNIVTKNECNIELFTIHTYKGLESDIVRIYNDIQLPKEDNLYYVALTRGMKKIILDNRNQTNACLLDKTQTRIINF